MNQCTKKEQKKAQKNKQYKYNVVNISGMNRYEKGRVVAKNIPLVISIYTSLKNKYGDFLGTYSEEIVSDGVLGLYKILHKYEENSNGFSSIQYIKTSIRNRMIDYIKKNILKIYTIESIDSILEDPNKKHSYEEYLRDCIEIPLGIDIIAYLERKVLDKNDKVLYVLFTLKYLEGKDMKEVAKCLRLRYQEALKRKKELDVVLRECISNLELDD